MEENEEIRKLFSQMCTAENISTLINARKTTMKADNTSHPFYSKEDADAYDKFVSLMLDHYQVNTPIYGPVSQNTLQSCVVSREQYESKENIIKTQEFLKKPQYEQWSLCRQRIKNMIIEVEKISVHENWPCHFGELDKAHQLFFNEYKSSFGSDRIAICIGPDTYSYVYMETCLLMPNTLDFLDDYGYSDQSTKECKTFEELIIELRRLIEIYKSK
jgi:hypothetical protein